MGLIASLVVALSLLSGAALAQDVGGTVCLRIAHLTAGTPAAMDVRPAATTAQTWTSPVGSSGMACVSGLPPGAYDARLIVNGQPIGSLAIRLGAGDDVTIDADAHATAGALRVADRVRVGAAVTFDRADLDALPTGGTLASIIDSAAPFAIADRIDDGGLSTGIPVRVGAQGASWTRSRFLLDGMDVTDPSSPGMPMMAIDPDALEAVSLAGAGAPIDVLSPGFAAGLAIRRPGATRQTSVEASFTSPGMTATSGTSPPPIDALQSFADGAVQFGGPLNDRTGVFLAGRVTRATSIDRGGPAAQRAEVGAITGQEVSHLSSRDTLHVMGGVQGVSHPFAPASLVTSAGTASERDTFAQAHATWDRQLASGAQWSIASGLTHGDRTPPLPVLSGATIERLTDGPMPVPGSPTSVTQMSAGITYTAALRRTGAWTHALAFGATVDHASMSAAAAASPTIGETVDGLAARAWQFVSPSSTDTRGSHEGWFYASDRLMRAALTINAAVRADLSSGAATGAAAGIHWRTISPRVSLRWAASPRLSLTASYARYQAPLTLDLAAWGDPAAPYAQVYRWIDANGNGRVDAGELGALVERVGPASAIASIDPSLRAPYTDEVSFGADVHAGARSTISARGLVRRERSLIGAVDVGVPASGYQTMALADAGPDYTDPSDDRPLTVYDRLPSSFGADQYLLTNPAGDEATFKSLEIQFEHRAGGLRVNLGASASQSIGDAGNRGYFSGENDQGVIGEEFGDPNAATDAASGRLFFDRAYVLKWATTYLAPHDVSVSAIARYQDGEPFSRWVIATGLAQGPEAVMAYPNGVTRFMFLATVDVRIMKTFALGHRRASAMLDVFNLLNTSNEVEEDAVTGPLFRQTTFVQPGRVIRLGVKVGF